MEVFNTCLKEISKVTLAFRKPRILIGGLDAKQRQRALTAYLPASQTAKFLQTSTSDFAGTKIALAAFPTRWTSRFFSASKDIERCLAAYIRANASAFAHLE